MQLREQINMDEDKWLEKEKICTDLLQLSSSKESDMEILRQSKYIMDGFAKICEPLIQREFKTANSLDSVMHIVDKKGEMQAEVNNDELKKMFLVYMHPNEFKKVEYKC